MLLLRGIMYGILFEVMVLATILAICTGASAGKIDPSATAGYTQQVLQRE